MLGLVCVSALHSVFLYIVPMPPNLPYLAFRSSHASRSDVFTIHIPRGATPG